MTQLFALLLAVTTPPSLGLVPSAEDQPEWGGFRGNNGTGVAESPGIPGTLDPEVSTLWRVEVPSGYSSPVVSGDDVYLTGVEGTELVTLALDRHSGEERWRHVEAFDGAKVGMNSSAAPSPVTDGARVYVLFHAIGLLALDLDGEVVWREELGGFNIPHGLSTSPVLHGGRLVLQIDQDLEAYLAAFDAASGEELWRVERPGVTHSYSTPAIWAPGEGDAQVIVSGSFQIRGYALDDGAELWRFDGSAWQTKSVPLVVGDRCFVNAYMVPSGEFGIPATKETFEDELVERDANGDGLIGRDEWAGGEMLQQAWFIFDLDGDEHLDEADWEYLRSSRRASGGLFAIDLGGEGDITSSHLAWKFGDRRGLPDCPTPVLAGGSLFLIKEGGLLTAVDPATGEVQKQGRVADPDPYFASPVAAAGRVITASVGGQLTVLSDGPEWEVLSVTDLGEEIWSTPAIAGSQVFVRSQEALWCFDDLGEPSAE